MDKLIFVLSLVIVTLVLVAILLAVALISPEHAGVVSENTTTKSSEPQLPPTNESPEEQIPPEAENKTLPQEQGQEDETGAEQEFIEPEETIETDQNETIPTLGEDYYVEATITTTKMLVYPVPSGTYTIKVGRATTSKDWDLRHFILKVTKPDGSYELIDMLEKDKYKVGDIEITKLNAVVNPGAYLSGFEALLSLRYVP